MNNRQPVPLHLPNQHPSTTPLLPHLTRFVIGTAPVFVRQSFQFNRKLHIHTGDDVAHFKIFTSHRHTEPQFFNLSNKKRNTQTKVRVNSLSPPQQTSPFPVATIKKGLLTVDANFVAANFESSWHPAPVTTIFPLSNTKAVHLGLRIRMTQAANFCGLYSAFRTLCWIVCKSKAHLKSIVATKFCKRMGKPR